MSKEAIERILAFAREPILSLKSLLTVTEAKLLKAQHHDASYLTQKTLQLLNRYAKLTRHLLIRGWTTQSLFDAMVRLLNFMGLKPQ
jgi:hypothetical protein